MLISPSCSLILTVRAETRTWVALALLGIWQSFCFPFLQTGADGVLSTYDPLHFCCTGLSPAISSMLLTPFWEKQQTFWQRWQTDVSDWRIYMSLITSEGCRYHLILLLMVREKNKNVHQNSQKGQGEGHGLMWPPSKPFHELVFHANWNPFPLVFYPISNIRWNSFTITNISQPGRQISQKCD